MRTNIEADHQPNPEEIMMRSALKSFLLALFLCGVGATMAAAQGPQPDSPAAARAKEFARLLDSGNRAALAAYAKENYTPGFLNVPMERHLEFLSSVYDFTRGVEFHSIQEAKPNE